MSDDVGSVVRVNGPIVHLTGLGELARFEYVEVGTNRIPGEIVTLDADVAVAQLYEYSGGLSVGEPAWASGQQLAVELHPGLLGNLYDGLLRPLADAGDFLVPARDVAPTAQTFRFEAAAAVGDTVGPGDLLGTVAGSVGPEHRVLVPVEVRGRIGSIAAGVDLALDDTVAVIGEERVTLSTRWPIRRPRPFLERTTERRPFTTGQRVLDLLEPIATGSSATVIGGFGEGKTMLLEQLAKWSDADVIVYLGCGERGNELADLIDELSQLVDPRTGRDLAERTVILANTSNMPVMAREASVYTAVTVAEYYRDMGHRAVIIADSTSRWAEARRELASRTGAIPAEEGYPADLPTALAAFYQRAGRVRTLGDRDGTVTIVTSVSPPGGDVTEPVAAHTQRFVQAAWTLDRELAYARHYPAISWDRSFSRDAEPIAHWYAQHGDPAWANRRARLRVLLAEAERLEGIADLVGVTALPTTERITLLTARLVREAVLQQSALSDNDASCSPDKQSALADAVLEVHETALRLGEAGVPATLIERVDFGPVVRAKDATAPDDADAVRAITRQVVESMRELAS